MRFIPLPSVASLVDGRYEREALLLRNGLTSFTPALHLVERLCESPQELEEYRRFVIANKKSLLGGSDLQEDQRNLERMRQEASERYERTKNVWERGFTTFDRHVKRLEAENPKYFGQLRQACIKESMELFAEEVSVFSVGWSHQFSEREPNARLNLYRDVMDRNAGDLGFSFDKNLSGKGKPIYSKSVIDHWRLCFSVDTVNLKMAVQEPSVVLETSETFRVGPFLELSLNLFNVPVGSKRGEIKHAIQLDSFFPIGDYFYAPYYHFYTLMELEALINIRLRMYKLMSPEIESRLMRDIENCQRSSIGTIANTRSVP